MPLVVVSVAGGTDNIHAKAWSAVGNHPLAATVEQACLVAVMAGTNNSLNGTFMALVVLAPLAGGILISC